MSPRRADGTRLVGWRAGYVPNQLAIDCKAVLAANPGLRPMGSRGVGYVLMGWPAYQGVNKHHHMDRVKNALIDARRGKFIPFGWVWDQKAIVAVPLAYSGFDGWLEAVRSSIQSLRLPRQAGQDRFIEVWTEAAATVVVIQRRVFGYGVPVYSSGGQHHLTGIRELAQRAARRRVPTLVLHLGDYDAKGRAIYERFREDVQAFNPKVEFERIGLLPEQITRLGLGALADANGDLQLEAMIANLGDETEAAIQRHMDLAVLATVVAEEKRAQQQARDALDGLEDES